MCCFGRGGENEPFCLSVVGVRRVEMKFGSPPPPSPPHLEMMSLEFSPSNVVSQMTEHCLTSPPPILLLPPSTLLLRRWDRRAGKASPKGFRAGALSFCLGMQVCSLYNVVAGWEEIRLLQILVPAIPVCGCSKWKNQVCKCKSKNNVADVFKTVQKPLGQRSKMEGSGFC